MGRITDSSDSIIPMPRDSGFYASEYSHQFWAGYLDGLQTGRKGCSFTRGGILFETAVIFARSAENL